MPRHRLPTLDALVIPGAIRHGAILGARSQVRPGAGMILVAPHDPLPLLALVWETFGEGVEIGYVDREADLAAGDGVRVTLTKTQRPRLPHRDTHDDSHEHGGPPLPSRTSFRRRRGSRGGGAGRVCGGRGGLGDVNKRRTGRPASPVSNVFSPQTRLTRWRSGPRLRRAVESVGVAGLVLRDFRQAHDDAIARADVIDGLPGKRRRCRSRRSGATSSRRRARCSPRGRRR
ncbi:DUF2249 domain-containing protein [Mobilicoccus massiliensis]|uniref:DUF2249 domain-containing protein n=1 Tax=Mobilicoccus massiliensis TaxID=1522310 RepID=UPI001FE82652|nr:DUF2249 domain-containing protein [Mobilicoccus massiliensis]